MDSWTASLAATRASRSASLVHVVEPMTHGISGPASETSLQLSLFDGPSSRTSPAICRWDSQRLPTTYEAWALKLRRACSKRLKWALHTNVPVSSSWPTARAEDAESAGKHKGRGPDSLTAATSEWQTPGADSFRSRGGDRKDEMGLDQQARKLWPTATAGDAAGGGSRNLPGSKAHAGVSLTDMVLFGGSSTPRNPDDPRTRDRLARLKTNPPSLWTTPSATDGDRSGAMTGNMSGSSLPQQLRSQWPTPAARDHKGENAKPFSERGGGTKGEQLPNFVAHVAGPRLQPTPSDGEPSSLTTPGSPLRLNPAFVEWLMGLPRGWTDFAFWATAWYRTKPSTRSACSCENSETQNSNA